MSKDALRLAKDLMDVRKIVSLEMALQTAFLADDMPEDRFMITSTFLWNGTEAIHIHKKRNKGEMAKGEKKQIVLTQPFQMRFWRTYWITSSPPET